MSEIKVYIKGTKPTYQESELIRKIRAALVEKSAKNPSIMNDFQPAKNYEELQQLFYKYAVDDAKYVDIPNKKDAAISGGDTHDHGTSNTPPPAQEQAPVIDPLNREEPIIRDYVQSNEFAGQQHVETRDFSSDSFDEPLNFNEAFKMPDESFGSGTTSQGPGQNNQGTSGGPKQGGQGAGASRKTAPLNPDFDDMSGNKKRKSTRKFAKYLVEGIVFLQEKGFIWFAQKNINDAKLAEYELNDEMDLSLFITLSDGQEGTVRQFFQEQCRLAEDYAKIDQDKVNDLTDALADVLMEKGFGPTPAQELLVIGLSILGEQAIKLVMIKSQTEGVLNQLRSMKAETVPHEDMTHKTTPPPKRPAAAPEEFTQPPVQDFETQYTEKPPVSPVEEGIAKEEAALRGRNKKKSPEEEPSPIIDAVIETKE